VAPKVLEHVQGRGRGAETTKADNTEVVTAKTGKAVAGSG
jgi:hypothetical protein